MCISNDQSWLFFCSLELEICLGQGHKTKKQRHTQQKEIHKVKLDSSRITLQNVTFSSTNTDEQISSNLK